MAWSDWFRNSKRLPQDLRDAYGGASKALDQFRGSHSLPYLIDAAKHLCDGLNALANDDDFWQAVGEHAATDSQRNAFPDLVAFLKRDRKPLQDGLGADERTIDNLLLDITALLETVQRSQRPNANEIGALRLNTRALANDVCRAAQKPQPDSKDLIQLMRIVKKGLVVVAGAAVVVGDGIAVIYAVPPDLCAYSAEVGIAIIVSQFPGRD